MSRWSVVPAVLVAQDHRELEVWSREGSGAWARVLVTSGQTAELAAIGCKLDVDALYDDAAELSPAT